MKLLDRFRLAATVFANAGSAGRSEWDDFWWGPAAGNTLAGVPVSETTALNVNSLMACVRLMCGVMASLPFGLYERVDRQDGSGRTARRPAPGHSVHQIIHDAFNDDLPADEAIAVMQLHFEMRSNAFAQKIISGRGDVEQLVLLHPDRMMVVQDRNDGSVKYLYRKGNGESVGLTRDDVFHLRGFGTDGMTGLSKILAHRETIGLTSALETYSAAHFGNGAQSPLVIKFPAGVKFKDQDAAKEFLRLWNEVHQGPFRAGKASILENGGDVENIGVTPEQSQALGARVFQLEEMARLVGYIPMHLLNDVQKETSWGTGIETQNTAFVQYGLLWRFRRWEGATRQQLLAPEDRSRYFSKFSADAFLRGDSEARGTFYQIMRRLGVYSDQDILEKEDMPPKDGPPTYWQPLDVRIVDGAGNPIYEPPAKGAAAEANPAAAFAQLLEGTLARVYKRAVQDWPKAHSDHEKERWATEHAAFMDSQLAPVFAAITAARVPLHRVAGTRLRPEQMGNGLDPVALARDEVRHLLGV